MENNMFYYEKVRKVPKTAQKEILGGRLKGFTDINPMWRISALTEVFGPVGIGWKYEILTPLADRFQAAANGEVCCMLDINLYVKVDGEWSEAIPGTGGSMYITNEKSGARTSDEACKMALTDALSVAAKALGVGADIYWAMGAQQTQTQQTKTTSAKTQAKASVPAVGDDLPAGNAKAATISLEEARKLLYEGKSLGEIADANPEDMKAIASKSTDKALRSACVVVYNAIATKKAS